MFDFKTAWKHWSTWFWAASLAALGLALLAPGWIIQYLPGLMSSLSPEWQQKAAMLLGLAGFLSKFVQQDCVKAKIAKFRAWLKTMGGDIAGTVQTKHIIGGSATAAAIAAAMTLATPALKQDEGKVNKAYLDAAHVLTACYGHTGKDIKIGKTYTDAECDALLNTDEYKSMSQVLGCAPDLRGDIPALAAWGRFNFNTGAFCSKKHGTMIRARQLIAEGRIKASCAEMSPWVYVGPIKFNGLVKRRARERAMCEAV